MAKIKTPQIEPNKWYAIYDPQKGFTQFGVAQSISSEIVLFRMQNGNMERYDHKYCTKIYEKKLLENLSK